MSGALSVGAQKLVDAAEEQRARGPHATLCTHHWLTVVLERHGAMAEAMAEGLVVATTKNYLRDKLRGGETGDPLDRETLLGRAAESAQRRGAAATSERDVASVVLEASGYKLRSEETSSEQARLAVQTSPTPSGEKGSPGGASSPSPAGGATPSPAAGAAASSPAAATAASWQPRSKRPTPVLEQFGRDLTKEFASGKLPPVVGRDDETELVIETLCRRTKRNPVLVGPAGVGKTAIVEGLAAHIVEGKVPEPLRDVRLFALSPSLLVSEASVVGELEKRIKAVLTEASQDGVIVFIDEVHSIVGAGGAAGRGDIATLLKPALARGEIACIAATTDDEYRRFIEPDPALERRFQPVRIQELSAEQTLAVLFSVRSELEKLRGVTVSDEVVRWLVGFAKQFLRNRHFPDKGVDLLEQCVAFAVTKGKKAVELADAETVAQRMVGMPLALSSRIAKLRAGLTERGLLVDADAASLVERLEVTMRGLDVRQARPNGIVLLLDEAVETAEPLAEMIADALFGASDRVVVLDLSRFVHPGDVALLVGAPPGYIGYSDVLPLHRVAQMPWCVLRLENVHACHPAVREVVVQALADGFIAESRGKRIYLSDVVVIATAPVAKELATRKVGFGREDEERAPSRAHDDARHRAEAIVGTPFVAQCDLVCTKVPAAGEKQTAYLREVLLTQIAVRYREQDIELSWDKTLLEWLAARHGANASIREWERLVDEELTPAIVPHLAASATGRSKALVVRSVDGKIQVEEASPSTKE
jgi:ATP-dependent Clp protease ATP-binding subunit ClpC